MKLDTSGNFITSRCQLTYATKPDFLLIIIHFDTKFMYYGRLFTFESYLILEIL